MKINKIILEGWESYKNKVANSLLTPENEKMMQLQLAQIYQALGPVYEYEASESIKVLLEVPVTIRGTVFRSIDLDYSSLGSLMTLRLHGHRHPPSDLPRFGMRSRICRRFHPDSVKSVLRMVVR